MVKDIFARVVAADGRQEPGGDSGVVDGDENWKVQQRFERDGNNSENGTVEQ